MGIGRPAGSSNKRTEEGREFARAVLLQDDADLTAGPAFGDKEFDTRATSNPVLRRLRSQARAGVGSADGLLPPNVFVHLCDRLYGKVLDRIRLGIGSKRPYSELSDAELAEKARLTATALEAAQHVGDEVV